MKKRTIIITGATSGIGKSAAFLFAEKGFNVIVTGRNAQLLESLYAETSILYIACDINDPNLPKSLIDLALSNFGTCDILVNNAGMLETGSVEAINTERICEMVRVNVEAAFRFIYTFVKYFKQIDNGHIVNISSVLGLKTREHSAAYAGTKHAIEAVSEGLRMELYNTNVQLTCIEPGLVKTEMHRMLEVHPTETLNIPNPLQPLDIAKAILYVVSQEAHVRIPKYLILPKNHRI
ncbi:MAG: SDR family oxidoreductase [Bacteroidales bacterium]|nr:SDR family oxidoreductase [Bacteroidales bacterium]